MFLLKYGVSYKLADKIYRTYEEKTITIMSANPYKAADDVKGIGFPTADEIAEKMGIEKNSPLRIESGIKYALDQLAMKGHVFGYREQVVTEAMGKEVLDLQDKNLVSLTLSDMLAKKDLGCEMDCIYLPQLLKAENFCAEKLKKLASVPAEDYLYRRIWYERQRSGNPDLSVDVSGMAEELGIQYDDVQLYAIRTAAASKGMVLTGGPGTGKTTVTQGIIEVFKKFKLHILLAAPTGRAAKRASESTGMEAKTIHRLLGYTGSGTFEHNEEHPLEGDVLIIDESSMVDIRLMSSLLKAVPENMRLILIGDVNQLPSVGPGTVLKNIIDSGVFPVVRLTKIFRQAAESHIVTNAHRINDGLFPVIDDSDPKNDFFLEIMDKKGEKLEASEIAERTAQAIIKLLTDTIPNMYHIQPKDIQILAPMRNGSAGTIALNKLAQEALNPEGPSIAFEGYSYRKGDRVMQTKNDYEKGVFNGDIGYIVAVNLEKELLKVEFLDTDKQETDSKFWLDYWDMDEDEEEDEEIEAHGPNPYVTYSRNDLENLDPAYAITIHKSQGSEFPAVIMPFLNSHFVMLERNLLYTGVTRAKKYLFLEGQRNAIYKAVKTISMLSRNSNLRTKLQGGFWTDLLLWRKYGIVLRPSADGLSFCSFRPFMVIFSYENNRLPYHGILTVHTKGEQIWRSIIFVKEKIWKNTKYSKKSCCGIKRDHACSPHQCFRPGSLCQRNASGDACADPGFPVRYRGYRQPLYIQASDGLLKRPAFPRDVSDDSKRVSGTDI
ncbi:MAG: AAA family ATPase [Coprococcus sp.]